MANVISFNWSPCVRLSVAPSVTIRAGGGTLTVCVLNPGGAVTACDELNGVVEEAFVSGLCGWLAGPPTRSMFMEW